MPLLRSVGNGNGDAVGVVGARSAPMEFDHSVCPGCFTTTVVEPSNFSVRVMSYPLLLYPGRRKGFFGAVLSAPGSKISAFASKALSSWLRGATSAGSCANKSEERRVGK